MGTATLFTQVQVSYDIHNTPLVHGNVWCEKPTVCRLAFVARAMTNLPIATGLPQARKFSGDNILQGQGKIREVYFESGKIDILKKSQGKMKQFNTAVLIPLKAGRNIWCH